jgi:hypothetical protein
VDLFNAEARRIQLGDVEQYLARLPPSSPRPRAYDSLGDR